MAISVLHATSTTGTSTSSLAVTITSTTVGNTLVAALMGSSTTDVPTGVSVTLGASGDTFYSIGAASFPVMYLFADYNCTGGETTLTFSYTATGTTGVVAYVYEISGLGATPALDQNAFAVSYADAINLFPGETMTSGYIQTTQANAILLGFGAAEYTSGTPTLTGPTGSWTNETGHSYTGSTHGYAISGYQVVSTTGTYSYVPTFTTTELAQGGIVAIAPGPLPVRPYIRQYTTNSNYNTNTLVTNFRSNAMAGSFIIALVLAYAYTGTSPTLSTVALEPSGDSMTAAIGPTTPASGYPTCGIYYYQNSPGSQTGITVTCTGSTSADNIICIIILEYAGVPVYGATVDATASASGSSTAPSSGATGTTKQINEIVTGVIGYSGPSTVTLTDPASPWSPGIEIDYTSSSHYGVLVGSYQIGINRAGYTHSATIGTSEKWVALAATFYTQNPSLLMALGPP